MHRAAATSLTAGGAARPRSPIARRVARAVLACGLLGSLATLQGCEPTAPDRSRKFIVRVDSIVAPATIASNDTLIVWFFGYVGNDGCSYVEHVDKYLTVTELRVTFRGKYDGRPGVACTMAPVSLHHPEVVLPPRSSPFKIIVLQPDGTLLQGAIVAP